MEEKLKIIDEEYPWAEFWNLDDQDERHVAYIIASVMYSQDASFDEETWAVLERVRAAFSDKVRDLVLHALFHRNHDT